MGFFDTFKSSGEEKEKTNTQVPWFTLGSMGQLDTILEESKLGPVAIFKHSTRCGISRSVLKAFENSYDISENQIKLYFLDLLANRDISNEIASRFKVRHESPQMIVLKNGVVVYQESHSGIDASDLKRFL